MTTQGHIGSRSVFASIAMLVALLIAFATPGSAQAQTVSLGCVQVDNSTTPPTTSFTVGNTFTTYGFTVGIVYCVKQSIYDAASLYIAALQQGLAPYKYLAITITLILFGIKLSMVNVKDLTKEGMGLLLKIVIMLFLIDNTLPLYNAIISGMGEVLGWVSAGFGLLNPSCLATVANESTLPPDAITFTTSGGVAMSDYSVWQQYDCMFKGVVGSVENNPSAFLISLVLVLAVAFFSSIVGVVIVLVGVCTVLSVFFMLMRSLFMVLLAYITIGFLLVLTPFIAPLLVFDFKYTKELFDRWWGMILSTALQPIFIIGYLSFAVMIIDTFIEGDMKDMTDANGNSICVLPQPGVTLSGTGTSATCTLNTNPTPGSGICSFSELFNPAGLSDADEETAMQCLIDPNATLFTWAMSGDPQGHSADGSSWNPLNWGHKLRTAVVNKVHQLIAYMGNLAFSGVARFKYSAPIRQLGMTLVAMWITVRVMRKLLDTIPKMARQITVGVGLALYQQATVPLQGIVEAGVKRGGEAMKASTGGGSGIRGIARAGAAGLKEGAKGSWEHAKDKFQ